MQRHPFQALALKVTVSFSSFDHNQKTSGRMRTKSSHLGRTSHLATGVDAAKSFSVTQCCHLLGKLGLCTVTSASATKPVMIKNVVITNGQLLSVLDRGGRSSRSTPAQTKMFPSPPEYCQSHSNTPLVLKHKLRMPVTTLTVGRILW